MAHCSYLSDECEYIIVENTKTGEEIVKITRDSIDITGEDILVRMKPTPD